MFNKTLITPARTEYVPFEKSVKHEYAPTSEQAQHLEDLQKQAWESVTAHMVSNIEDNFLSGIEVHRQRDFMILEEKVFAIFTLNGEKFEIEVGVKDELKPDGFIEALAEALSKKITSKILEKALTKSDAYRQR